MSETVRQSIYEAISSVRLIDPHTHIDPRRPASSTLADILGYHYYTELVHSAGMTKAQIEEQGVAPRDLVRRLVGGLQHIENTANYAWLIELCRTFFEFTDDRIDNSNWESLYDASEDSMASAEWPQMVLDKSNVEAVFLTNDFDDDLQGFDTDTYIPCLRTDDLVFHLCKPETRQRLEVCSGIGLDGSLSSLRDALRQRFDHFVASGARACAISIPPAFEPVRISDGRAATAWDHVLSKGMLADAAHQVALSRRVFWTLAELCDEYGLPFDLMIGVNRGVYADGVYQGQDLYDSRVSLIQYRELFNAFPDIKFPISVLASVTNQELVSHAWIFPNVFTNGHWWYSNTPSFIARDAAARLEAVPRNKQIAYYSDAYKLEFIWPKFDMYRRVLADVLTDQFVVGNGWSEERAIDLGKQVLRDNVDAVFARQESQAAEIEIDEIEVVSMEPEADTQGTESLLDASLTTPAAFEVAGVAMTQFDDQPEDESQAEILTAAEDVAETHVEESSTGDADQIIEVEVVDDDLVFDEIGQIDRGDQEIDEHETLGVQPAEADDEFAELPLDPLPTEDEVSEVHDILDVELVEPDDAGEAIPSADVIGEEAELETLDVGDLFSDEPTEEEAPEVEMLRGESSFSPGEESLRLSPDPATGEWTMSIDAADEDEPADVFETLEFEDDSGETADSESIFADDDSASENPEANQDDIKQQSNTLETDDSVDFDEYSTPSESPERDE